jgi:N-acetyl-anhydromuramyl-L-alanine amidase AmpD
LKTAAPANQETIWAFGQSWDFHIVTTDHILGNADFGTDTHQKTQIVLHGTAGNGTAEDVIDNWNGDGRPASAHFAVERAYVPQAARAAGASEQSDAGLVDVVRIVPEDQRSFHGGVINCQLRLELVCRARPQSASSGRGGFRADSRRQARSAKHLSQPH